jgi:DNA-binding response OmpR family regulator
MADMPRSRGRLDGPPPSTANGRIVPSWTNSADDGATHPGSVLLVEDEDVLRDALADALRRRGIDTVDVGSAEDAAAQLTGGFQPSLVFLDLNLPGRSGWDLLREELAPAPGRPPIVLLTALSVDPSRMRQFGVGGYLPKPFALATFLDTAQRFLAAAGRATS